MIWTQPEIDLLSSIASAGKHRYQDMLPLFPGKTRWNLIYRLKKLGLKNTYRTPPKYTYNTAYFDEITIENAYWAGILQTDGYIGYRQYGTVIIWGCGIKDRAHIEWFQKCINSTHPILTQWKKCQLSTKDPSKVHLNCRISFEGAKQWAAALKKHYGFDQNKTLRTAPPNLPTLLHKLAYIKGLIDGDGTVTHSNPNGGIHISLCGCNRELLMWVQNVIGELNLPNFSRRPRHINQAKGENCYYLNYSGLRAAVLHEILLRVPCPHLDRKWNAPKAMEAKAYWSNRPDIWPSEVFFQSILKRG